MHQNFWSFRSVRIGNYSSANMKLSVALMLVVAFSTAHCQTDVKGGAGVETKSGSSEDFDLPIYFSYIQKLVDSAAQNRTVQGVIEQIRIYQKGDKAIDAYIALHFNLKNNNKLDQPGVINLAYALKDTMKGMNQTDKAYKNANVLKNSLPTSVRNLVFSNCILIRRGERKEDMYAPVNSYKLDANRRRIFTWIPGDPQNNKQGCWSVKPENLAKSNAFFIQNSHSKEYLYAAYDKYNIDQERRSVFTWTPGGSDKQSRWTFEPSGQDMYIKSILFGEYLTTDDDTKFDKDRRKVYTALSKQKSKKSLWKIVDGDTVQKIK